MLKTAFSAVGWTEPRLQYLRLPHSFLWLRVLDLPAASAMACSKAFRGSPSLLKSMSETRQSIARMNQLLPAPGCKWQQNKVDKKLLPHLLPWSRQVTEGKGLGKGIENQSLFFARNMNCYFRKTSPLMWNCIQEPPAIQKEPRFSPEPLLLFLVALRQL